MRKTLSSILIVLSLNLAASAEDAVFSIDADNSGFGGGVDYVSADKIANKYAPIDGILNVNTDRYNEITKKYGSVAYNTTALTGTKKLRRAYTYNQQDGDSYIITTSSYAIFASKGDGSFSTIISTLSDTADCDFTTGTDGKLYWTDSIHTPGMWDGTNHTAFTVSNSTNYPTFCKYIANWRSRNWMFGDTRYPTRIYYSEPYVVGLDTGAYANYPIQNYVDFGVPDGDLPTGLQVAGGELYAYFQHKIFKVVELNTGIFGYNLLSNNIGCLYNTTLDILNGFPIFVSHRGIEQFDGSQCELKSLPIDFYVKNLRQLTVSRGSLVQTTAADWGAGGGVNIDTTTYGGSVAINNSTMTYSNPVSSTVYVEAQTTYIKQGFWFSEDVLVKYYQINAEARGLWYQGQPFDCEIQTSTGGVLASIEESSGWEAINLRFAANATYYIYLNLDNYYWPTIQTTIYTTTVTTNMAGKIVSDNANLNGLYYLHIGFLNVYESASFTTQSSQAGSWGSWGTFTVDETKPTGSTINYWAITATSTYNLSTNTSFPLINGGSIDSAVGPYVKIISSFTRTNATAIPKLNELSITYYGANNDVPCGKVYKDAYYLSVNTGTASSSNDCMLVLQKNGDWTRYSNTAGCLAVYRDNLYYGDSQDTGKLYRMEVPGLYTDNGNAYASYWTSKKIKLHPFYKTNVKDLWITAAGIDGDLDISYNFNDYLGSWYADTLSLTSTNGITSKKIPLLPSTYSRCFQFRVGNDDAVDFRIKRLDLIYDSIPAIE
jgi:hypothetical protein